MGPGTLLSSMPWRARALVLGVLLMGVAATAAAIPHVPRDADLRVLLAGAALVVVATFFLQVHSPAITWRGQSMSVYLDEGVFLVGFVALPPAVVVVAGVVSSAVTQAFLRKHPVKAGFNVAAQGLVIGASALAFVGLGALGMSPLLAAAAVPLVMSCLSLSLIAILLCMLRGESPTRAFRPALFGSIALSAVAGAASGYLALGLFAAHPLAPALLVPLGLLLHKAVTLEYRHRKELATRRALQHAHGRLLSGAGEDGIVEAGLFACEEALDLVSAEVRVGAKTWTRQLRVPAGPTRVVSAPLVDERGAPMGELRTTVSWNGDRRIRESQGAVSLVAGSLSMALATAAALRSTREARQGLRDVLDAAREPIVAWDPEGRTVHANEAAKLLFGDAGPEGVAALLEPDSAEAFRLALAGPPGDTAEVEAWTQGGRALEMRKGPITLPGDRVGTLLVARDVTERRRLEREAALHREAMARTERLASLGILASGVAHEVNSPLMYIQGNLELTILDLEEMEPTFQDPRVAQARQQLATALSGVDRIHRITRGLGILGRPERARPPQGCDVGEAVAEGVEEARAVLPEGAWVQRISPEPLVVHAHAADLRQIAYHLARNAREAAGPEGRVMVATMRVGDEVELRVEDDGPGVAPEDAPKLFTPFFTTKPDGTGLGLPIALALARAAGGDVTHEPRPGGGALFRARFPLRPTQARPREAL